MVAKSVSGASLNPPPSRNRCSSYSASASPHISNSIENVVQTRLLPELILNDLALFGPLRDELRLGTCSRLWICMTETCDLHPWDEGCAATLLRHCPLLQHCRKLT